MRTRNTLKMILCSAAIMTMGVAGLAYADVTVTKETLLEGTTMIDMGDETYSRDGLKEKIDQEDSLRFYNIGKVDLTLSESDTYVAIYDDAKGKGDYTVSRRGVVTLNLSNDRAKGDKVDDIPVYRGTLVGLCSVSDPETAGMNLQVGEMRVDPKAEDGYTRVFLNVREDSGKPFWLVYKVTNPVGYSQVALQAAADGKCRIEETVFTGLEEQEYKGAQDPKSVKFEVLGVIPFEEPETDYEVIEGEAADTIQFAKPVTGIIMVTDEDAQDGVSYYTLTGDKKVELPGKEETLLGIAIPDAMTDHKFELESKKTFGELFKAANGVSVSDLYGMMGGAYRNENGQKIYSDAGTVKKVQNALNEAGYNCGKADGIAGKNTHAAMNKFQEEHKLKVTNEITEELLKELHVS